MFGLLKKKTLKGALKKTTADLKKKYPKSLVSGDPFFSNEEINIITQIQLFKNVESRYKDYSLSGYGGLCWFISKFIGEVIDKIENQREINPSIHTTAYKLSFYARLLVDSIPSLTLKKNDMKQIKDAGLHANKYFELTQGTRETSFPAS
ncbi:hypothetical protein [Desulfoluna sp.]|uniref:hypothetical protein n=1 Tax=Desulfoluna sp. TaxID=2045199 RepID=UPI0026320A50|nr:hypothetical protein [Desulfoluna sp.]